MTQTCRLLGSTLLIVNKKMYEWYVENVFERKNKRSKDSRRAIQYRPARKNVCQIKLRLNLLGPIRNWS